MKFLIDLPSDESINGEVMTPATTGLSDIETVISSTLPLVQSVKSDAQQLCPIPNMETQLIGFTESTKPPNHEMIVPQGM